MSQPDQDHAGLLSRIQSSLNDFYRLQGSRNEPSAFDDPAAYSFSDWISTVDIKENRRRFLVKVDVPGIDPKNIEVTMDDAVLAIRGERKTERESNDENHRLRECSYGAFERRFRLPATADENKIAAKSDHGVLTITIGKKRLPKVEKIKIE